MAHPDRAAEVKGFHVNGLYTPIGLGDSWAKHAAAWEAAKGNPARVQVFHNTRLGEVVKAEREEVDWQVLAARREPYRLRTVADNGRALPISCTLVDAGFLQHEVANFTRPRRSRRVFAAKGSTVATRPPIGRPNMVDVRTRGKVDKRGLELYTIGVSALKTLIYRRIKADAGTPEAPVLPSDRHIRISADLPDEYCRQVSAEAFDPKLGWFKRYDRNEALDTLVLGIAAGMQHSVAVHRLREHDWERLEQTLAALPAPATGDAAAVPGRELVQPARAFLPSAANVGRSLVGE